MLFLLNFIVGMLVQKMIGLNYWTFPLGLIVVIYGKFLWLHSFKSYRHFKVTKKLRRKIETEGLYISLDKYKGNTKHLFNQYTNNLKRRELLALFAKKRLNRPWANTLVAYPGIPSKDIFRNQEDYLRKKPSKNIIFLYIPPTSIGDELYDSFYFRPYDHMVFINYDEFVQHLEQNAKIRLITKKTNQILKKKGKRYYQMVTEITISYILFLTGIFGINEGLLNVLSFYLLGYHSFFEWIQTIFQSIF